MSARGRAAKLATKVCQPVPLGMRRVAAPTFVLCQPKILLRSNVSFVMKLGGFCSDVKLGDFQINRWQATLHPIAEGCAADPIDRMGETGARTHLALRGFMIDQIRLSRMTSGDVPTRQTVWLGSP